MFFKKLQYSLFLFLIFSFQEKSFSAEKNPNHESLRTMADDTTKVYYYYNYIDQLLTEGNIYLAMEAADEVIPICEKIKSYHQEKRILDLIGASANNHGKYKQALNYYFISKKLGEKTGNKILVSESLNGIGIVYWYTGENDKALKFYNEALKIAISERNYMQAASLYNNIGMIYRQRGDYRKASSFYYRSIDYCIKNKHESGLANAYNNLGVVYEAQKQYDQALNYFTKSLEIRKKIDDRIGITTSLGNLGSVYLGKKDYTMAEKYLRESYLLSLRIDDKEGVKENSYNLSEMFELKGASDSALYYYKIFIGVRDSLINEETKREGVVREMEYEFEKQQTKKAAEVEADKKKQRYILISTFAVLAVVLFFSFLLMKRFRITKRQNEIIKQQKSIVEEKQKEILASIHYAKRIQQAQLPSLKYMERHLGKDKRK